MSYPIFDLLLSLVVIATTMHFFAVRGVEKKAIYNTLGKNEYLASYIIAMMVYGAVVTVMLIVVVVRGKLLGVTLIVTLVGHVLIHTSVFYYKKGIEAAAHIIHVSEYSFLRGFDDVGGDDMAEVLSRVRESKQEE